MSRSKRIITSGGYIGNFDQDSITAGGVWTSSTETSFYTLFNPNTFFDDFEAGSFDSQWTKTSGIGLDTSNARDSQSCVFTSNSNVVEGRVEPNGLSGGVEISEFEIYYYETNGSNGAVAYLEDPNGNFILGVGTNNPQVHVWRGESSQNTKVGRLDTGVWVRARLFNINWSTGDFDYEFDRQNQSGTEISGSDTMDNPTSVSSLVLSPTNFDDSPAPNSGSSAAGNHWWDNVLIKP